MDNEVRINMEYMAHVQNCFVQSSLVQMTRQMIHNQLLNNGIVFRQGGGAWASRTTT